MTQLPFIAQDVSFTFKDVALIHNLNFSIEKQGVTILMGPNGAGKSLTLALMSGLLAPSRGVLHWNKQSTRDAMKHQAMLFQKPLLLRRSVLANLTFPLALKGLARPERQERALHHLQTLGLAHLAQQDAHKLSLGQMHIIALLRATIINPLVLFLDEPTASLDTHSTQMIERNLMTLKNSGTTIVMTTHDAGQGKRLADDVLFIHQGQLCDHATAHQFFSNPHSRQARQFLKGDLIT